MEWRFAAHQAAHNYLDLWRILPFLSFLLAVAGLTFVLGDQRHKAARLRG